MGRSRGSAKKKKQRAQAARKRKGAPLARKRKAVAGVTAETADKYDLYQRAVQSPDDDVVFLDRVAREMGDRPPRHLREDFCGTGLLAAAWLQSDPARTAEGFDIDPQPVDWGRERNFGPLGDAAQRMTFHLKDVREPSARKPDLRVAFNFSYCCFKQRQELLGYFRSVYEDLPEGGVFILDIHGGPECQEEMEEERKVGGGVTYVWEQAEFWPGTAETRCAISFEFKDGTSLRRCFEYDWRLWTLPELKDALAEVGFRNVTSFWEGDGDDGTGDGEFQPDDRGENCLSWISYLVGVK